MAAGFRRNARRPGHGQPLGRRRFVAAGVAAAAIGAAAGAQPAPATVFSGGTILTVDGPFSEAEAVAIRGNRILAVGSAAEVRQAAGPDAAHVDFAGLTFLPGFMDPHAHAIAGGALDSIDENVGATRFRTAAEVLKHLRARFAATAPGEWVLARNFEPSLQDGHAALTFAELDAASDEAPVFVLNASGHIAYANRAAFRAAGIPEDVADPPGAEFVRDVCGRLTGEMKNVVAFIRVLSAAPPMGRLDPVEALIGLMAKWNRVGLTTASELSLGTLTNWPADAAVLAAAAASGRLTGRIRAYPFYTIATAAWNAAGVAPGGSDALARVAGFKLVADGSNQGFTDLQREPYLNSTSRGIAYMTPAEMTSLALDRARRGWPLALHANGDAAIEMVLDTCQALRDAGVDLFRVRPRIEHCSMLHDEQIARMRALGVSASFLIGHVQLRGVWMRDRLFGPERVRQPEPGAQRRGRRRRLHAALGLPGDGPGSTAHDRDGRHPPHLAGAGVRAEPGREDLHRSGNPSNHVRPNLDSQRRRDFAKPLIFRCVDRQSADTSRKCGATLYGAVAS